MNPKDQTIMQVNSNKIFIFDKIRVFFKHTDSYGFLHPYNFLEWTSYVREAYFSEMCPNFREITNSPIKMMTAKITSTVYGDSVFGDDIEARFTTSRIKKVSFDVIIHFYNKRLAEIVCQTQHTLVFVDSESQKFTAIPCSLRQVIVYYENTGKFHD